MAYREIAGYTNPTNIIALIVADFCASSVLKVWNLHIAFSPFGVLSVFQVWRVIFPSGVPVARIPRCEYSRSWKVMDVIGGGKYERLGE